MQWTAGMLFILSLFLAASLTLIHWAMIVPILWIIERKTRHQL